MQQHLQSEPGQFIDILKFISNSVLPLLLDKLQSTHYNIFDCANQMTRDDKKQYGKTFNYEGDIRTILLNTNNPTKFNIFVRNILDPSKRPRMTVTHIKNPKEYIVIDCIPFNETDDIIVLILYILLYGRCTPISEDDYFKPNSPYLRNQEFCDSLFKQIRPRGSNHMFDGIIESAISVASAVITIYEIAEPLLRDAHLSQEFINSKIEYMTINATRTAQKIVGLAAQDTLLVLDKLSLESKKRIIKDAVDAAVDAAVSSVQNTIIYFIEYFKEYFEEYQSLTIYPGLSVTVANEAADAAASAAHQVVLTTTELDDVTRLREADRIRKYIYNTCVHQELDIYQLIPKFYETRRKMLLDRENLATIGDIMRIEHLQKYLKYKKKYLKLLK